MKWISLQEVDEIEALLFQLFKVSQERKELDKLSKSIIGDVPSLDALERLCKLIIVPKIVINFIFLKKKLIK